MMRAVSGHLSEVAPKVSQEEILGTLRLVEEAYPAAAASELGDELGAGAQAAAQAGGAKDRHAPARAGRHVSTHSAMGRRAAQRCSAAVWATTANRRRAPRQSQRT